MFDKENFLREEVKRLALLYKCSESEQEKSLCVDRINKAILQASKNISFAFGDELEELARAIAFGKNDSEGTEENKISMLFGDFNEDLYRKAAEEYATEKYHIGEINGKNTEKIDVIKAALAMGMDINTIAQLVRLSKQEVEEIISKLPAYEEPLAYGSLTEEQFNEEIEKAMEDIKAGRVYSAKEVEEEYDNVVANEAYKEYVESGCKSKSIEELWRELNKNFDDQ